MEFSKPEYWSRQPFPSPGNIPNPEIKPRSPTLEVDSLPAKPQGKPKNTGVGILSLLQGIFLTQELNWGLLHYRWILYQLTGLCFLESVSCEKEIPPAILINKTCHSHQRFLASKCERELPKLYSNGCYPPARVIAEELGECKKQGELGSKQDWSR